MSKQKIPKVQLESNYIPASLHKYTEGYRIEYYVSNPLTGELVRQRIRVDKIFKAYKLKRDALQHIDEMCAEINAKLRSGFNPFYQGEDSRLYEAR